MTIWSTRLAGIAGILSVLVMIPAYVVGTPDRPSSLAEADRYFADSAAFVVANGTVPVLHVFFFLFLLGGLVTWLRTAEDEPTAGPTTALAGGLTFIVLTAAGFCAEVLAPAVITRFGVGDPGSDLAASSLMLAVWLYHYCQVGASVMIIATAAVGARTGLLPRWAVIVALVLAVLTLLHVWLGAWSAYAGLLAIALISVLMVLSEPGRRAVPAL
jgi:hypothetical protein